MADKHRPVSGQGPRPSADGSPPAWSTVLRALRETRGYTQDAWADWLGLSSKTVRRWEHGETAPDAHGEARLLALCAENGLLRAYVTGPLAGLTLTPSLLQTLLAEARLSLVVSPPPAAPAPPAGLRTLPVPLTSFLGREQDLAALTPLLQQNRLLTLTGPGGTGKTRLALAVARQVADAFPDGVWFVDLSGVSDPTSVIPAIAQALGLREVEGVPLLVTLTAYVRPRTLLLVLDNFEQLVDATAVVAALLGASAGLRVLVTSRITLHAAGEQEYPAPPLSLPAGASLAAVARSAAVELFVQRARAARPDFRLTSDNAAAVAAICARLDGLPLALELAAARVKLLAPHALLARLESSLKLLTGGARTLPQRQQTLRETIQWSWDLLAERERGLFRRLAVFAGGWTLEAAEAICNPDGELDVFEALTALVDHSLITQHEAPPGELRFRMLATLQEYAWEQLAAAGETERVQRRAAAYWVDVAATVDAQFWQRGASSDLAPLDADQGNLRAALRWTLAAGEVDLGLRLVGHLAMWFFSRAPTEGRQTAELLLALPGPVTARTRVLALSAASVCASQQADGAAARALCEEAAALCRDLGEARLFARVLVWLAFFPRPHHPEDHVQCGREALALVSEEEEPVVWTFAYQTIGMGEVLLGDIVQGRADLARGLALARQLQSDWLIGAAVTAQGGMAYAIGDLPAARQALEEGVVLLRDSGDTANYAVWLCGLAAVALREGETAQAQARLAEALRLFQELGSRAGHGICVVGLAGVLAQRGRAEQAAQLLGSARTATGRVRTGPAATAGSFLRRLAHEGVQAQLGAAAFATALAEGQALSLEQATTLAIEALAGVAVS